MDANLHQNGSELWLGICVDADWSGVTVLVESDKTGSQVAQVLRELMPEFERS